MSILLIALLAVAALGGLAYGLAQHWANTPHGRLQPIFAFVFRLAPLMQPGSSDSMLGADRMTTPAERVKVRADFLKSVAPLARAVPFSGRIEERILEGPGGEIPVRIYTPPGVGPFPLLVYLHGGGFVVGSRDYTDPATRTLAARTPAVVVSVDYRMAPEHPFPAAVDDSEFALQWAFENAHTLGARRLAPVAVAGDSAGGNLAAVLAQRDARAGGQRVGLQALIYPAVDGSRVDRDSHRHFGRGYGLSMKDIEGCFAAYVPEGVDRTHPDLSPLHAETLAGMAPAYVVTAGFDVLRDEGTEYAERLAEEGVPVRHVHEPAMPHGYITMTRLTAVANETLEQIAAEIRVMDARNREALGGDAAPALRSA